MVSIKEDISDYEDTRDLSYLDCIRFHIRQIKLLHKQLKGDTNL